MFTTSCFIRKNTPELRKRLEELGYKPFGSVKYEWDTGWGLSTDNRLGEFESFDHNGLKNIIKCSLPDYEYSIDCGENEELFFAIAALRNDTDKYQWFYSTGWTDFEGNPLPDKWVFCDQDTLEHFAWVNNSPNSYKAGWKKATVEELIKFYNK